MIQINSIVSSIFVLCIFGLFGCKSEQSFEERRPEGNVIKEYVNTPKQKAWDARKKVEESQQKVYEQFQELEE